MCMFMAVICCRRSLAAVGRPRIFVLLQSRFVTVVVRAVVWCARSLSSDPTNLQVKLLIRNRTKMLLFIR